jgi:hypothetical protein
VNFSPSWLTVYSPAIIISSFVLSALLEILIWATILRARFGITDLIAVGGWMTLIQGVSTPLSFAISLLLYPSSIGLFASQPAVLFDPVFEFNSRMDMSHYDAFAV